MSRRKARQSAVQYIFAHEFGTADDPEEFLDYLGSPKSKSDRDFSLKLIKGTLDNIEAIDFLIGKYAEQGYDMILLIDRCILRVAIYEMLFLGETPPAVVIDEYVEITKTFSKETSAAFVNAVLDRVMKDEYEGKGNSRTGS